MPKTALIVSSGRTGTQFLAHYFDGNFDAVVGRHEPPPRHLVQVAASAYAAGAVSRQRMARILVRRRTRTADLVDADLYVESNPFLWGAVDLFDEVYDEPVVVHVVRDPRDQVRSSLNHGTASGFKGLVNRFVPYRYPRLPAGGRPRDWVERAVGLWAVVNHRLSELGPRCAGYHFVRYEHLFDETNSGLRDLCARLGLDFAGAGASVDPAERINRAQGSATPDWTRWTDAQCATVHQIAGAAMARYGYGGEPEWLARVGPNPGTDSRMSP